ncbi:hypothetical protein DDE01_12040 [Desulfovibrio desulfuricans]|nr:hypothetical protein DDE01_12040 [Desulfovibrio desulfuricans]
MPDMQLGPQHRALAVAREQINEESRTVELAFSSEEPYERWWGTEILDHGPKSIRLGRMKQGAALLCDHNTRDQIGVVESVTIGADRVGRAVVRFGKSARAEEVYQDVKDGIRRWVSVGYQIHKMLQEESDPDNPTYRVTDWEPFEVSIVAVPADPTVGVGRNTETNALPVEVEQRENTMPTDMTAAAPAAPAAPVVDQRAIEEVRNAARDAELARVRDIYSLAGQHNAADIAERAVKEGMSLADFQRELLETKYGKKAQPLPDNAAAVGLTEKEARQYSLFKAIRAHVDKDWSDAGLERECSRAVAQKLGRSAQGFFVPYEALAVKRDYLSVGLTNHTGEKLVATDLLSGSFIELLRNRMVMSRMGATVLPGLVGNVAIPKQTGGATAAWVAEDSSASETIPTIGQVTLSPKTVSARSQITRQLLQQSSIDVENMVRNDLATALAIAIDRAAIHGTGADNQPRGILSTTGIGSVVGGENGAAPTWSHIVALETEVAVDNADLGSLAYLTNSKVRGKLKQTFRNSTASDVPLWADGAEGMGMLNGYRAAVTNQVASNLTKGTATSQCSAIIFGNFADFLIGMWGALDLLPDPYSGSDTGRLKLVAFQDCDMAVRHAESFAAMQDALTE